MPGRTITIDAAMFEAAYRYEYGSGRSSPGWELANRRGMAAVHRIVRDLDRGCTFVNGKWTLLTPKQG